MSIAKRKPDHISQEDWDSVDSPPMTPEFMAGMRPTSEVRPEFLKAYHDFKRGRGPQKTPTKKLVSIRLDQDVVDHFQATGEGWQTRINDALRKLLETAK